MALEYERLAVDVRPPVATITLNDPARGNALGDTMRQELLQALLAIQDDASVQVVVLRGSGGEFCRGLPEGELAGLREGRGGFERVRPLLDEGRRLVSLLDEFPKPVVAAIDGLARAEGAALALACGLRVAGPEASLSLDFATEGLAPAWGVSKTLVRLAGEGRALELLWTGRVLDAEEALRYGLVERVATDLDDELAALVRELAERGATLLHLTRMAIQSSRDCDLSSSLDLEAEIQHRCWEDGRDHRAARN